MPMNDVAPDLQQCWKHLSRALTAELPKGSVCTWPHSTDTGFWFEIINVKPGARFEAKLHVTPGQTISLISVNAFSPRRQYARHLLRGLCAAAPMLGIATFDLTATRVGAWLWGRAGFAPCASDWNGHLKQQIWSRLELIESDLPPHVAFNMHRALQSRDPTAFWTLCDTTTPIQGASLGYYLCADTNRFEDASWIGALSLRNDQQRERLHAYCWPTTSSAPRPA